MEASVLKTFREIVTALAQQQGCTVFVETGTFRGGTTKWAATQFKTVHTVERSQELYNLHHQELDQIPGVTTHLGDSRSVLPQIVNGLGSERAVHWLDGHWSGGPTAGQGDECPIMDELATLANRPDDILLIDDARLFLCAPPKPHDASQWATVADIVHGLPESGKHSFIQIVDDVIFVIPNDDQLKATLIAYAQRRSEQCWKDSLKFQRQNRPLKSRLRSLGRRITG